jgi:hypothetical protein
MPLSLIIFHPRSSLQHEKKTRQRNTSISVPNYHNFFVKQAIIMPTTVRVTYCVVIDANEDGRIDWIKTQERMERFTESYDNEDDGAANRSAKRVCTVPPSNSLFALAAQAVATNNEDHETSLPIATKEDVERIRDVYPILVTIPEYEEGGGGDYTNPRYDVPEGNHIQGLEQDIRSG